VARVGAASEGARSSQLERPYPKEAILLQVDFKGYENAFAISSCEDFTITFCSPQLSVFFAMYEEEHFAPGRVDFQRQVCSDRSYMAGIGMVLALLGI